MDIQGGVAIVTGSSSGVGAACARQLAERGCHVVINYSKNEARRARQREAACAALGVETLVVRGDVADDARLSSSWRRPRTRSGAASTRSSTTPARRNSAHTTISTGSSKQDFLDIYSVNTVGAYQMTRAVAAGDEARRPRQHRQRRVDCGSDGCRQFDRVRRVERRAGHDDAVARARAGPGDPRERRMPRIHSG